MKRRNQGWVHFVLWGCLLSLFTGCGAHTRTRMMVDSMQPLIENTIMAARMNGNIEIVKQSWPSSLVQMDGLVRISPRNRYLLTTAAESNYNYAYLFVEPEDREEAAKLYQKAGQYALRAMELTDEFAANRQGDLEAFKKALNAFEKEDVRTLFFYTASQLAWIRVNKKSGYEVLNEFPKLEALMDRMLALDESFNYGAVHVLAGSFQAARPDILGGNMARAKFHFDQAFDISESKFLLWHLFYARYYAVRAHDKPLFIQSLQKIVAAPEDILPNERFITRMAQKKAARMLQDTPYYFPE